MQVHRGLMKKIVCEDARKSILFIYVQVNAGIGDFYKPKSSSASLSRIGCSGCFSFQNITM